MNRKTYLLSYSKRARRTRLLAAALVAYWNQLIGTRTIRAEVIRWKQLGLAVGNKFGGEVRRDQIDFYLADVIRELYEMLGEHETHKALGITKFEAERFLDTSDVAEYEAKRRYPDHWNEREREDARLMREEW